jgi:hypothetical protein
MVRSLTILCLLVWPARALAQDCPPPARPFFEFQVERPATFIPDSSMAVYPAPQDPRAPPRRATLVSFIVDALGQPDTVSYKVIRNVDPGVAAEGRALLSRWRYRPAQLRGCAVPQLVQTLLERK